MVFGNTVFGTPTLHPTPAAELYREGTARLVRFHRADGRPSHDGAPLLIVPSMINRWYVVDLRPGFSLVEAMLASGRSVYCLDWGVPRDEDRYLEWEDVLQRLARAVRRVRRESGHDRIALLGYCMGGTLTAIHTALHPEGIAGLVNLLGPIDFESGGALRTAVDPRWFDPEAMTAPGNLPALQMQAGFTALRPTLDVAKWVRVADTWHKPGAMEAFQALEAWASDNVPFPGRAYVRYIRDLYQNNDLVEGRHRVGGAVADLAKIECPVLTVTADRDTICPPDAATALNRRVSSRDKETLEVQGGHVGAVVGGAAARVLYPGLRAWLDARFTASPRRQSDTAPRRGPRQTAR